MMHFMAAHGVVSTTVRVKAARHVHHSPGRFEDDLHVKGLAAMPVGTGRNLVIFIEGNESKAIRLTGSHLFCERSQVLQCIGLDLRLDNRRLDFDIDRWYDGAYILGTGNGAQKEQPEKETLSGKKHGHGPDINKTCSAVL
jgi:hypothetical protein